MTEPVLDVKSLNVRFIREDGGLFSAVYNSCFEVYPGEILAIVGESGSGKSVTALSLMGLIDAKKILFKSTNSIMFKGRDLTALTEEDWQHIRGEEISMIFQEPMSSLNPLIKVGEQIAEIIREHKKVSAKRAKARARYLLRLVGIDNANERMNAYPFELSGGQRQRVMIAMAVANNPKILIADEPTTALDVTVQKQILDLIVRLKNKFNMAVIFISHDLNVVRKIADRVLVMRQGVIVEQGSVGNIFHAATHPYTKELLAAFRNVPTQTNFSSQRVMDVRNVSVAFPLKKNFWGKITKKIQAVDNVSLTLSVGKTLGIVGESGSGKTTLGMCLADLITYEGEIFLAKSVHVQNEHDFRKNIQVVFQDPYNSLNPRLTIRDIVGEGIKVHFPQFSKEEITERVKKFLAVAGLSDEGILNLYPHEFSGGQRQRIAIARALAVEPKIMILDEPTSALDVTVQAEIIKLLKKIQKETGIAYLFISHDMRAVRAISHEVAVMRHGKIVEFGSADDIFLHPQADYTKELINAAVS